MDDTPLHPLDPRIEAAIAGWVEDGWPSEPEVPTCEVREAGAWELRRPAATPALVVDVREAARMLGCGRSLLYQLITAGEIQAIKIGRLSRIPVAALEEFIARKVAERRMSRRPWWEEDFER